MIANPRRIQIKAFQKELIAGLPEEVTILPRVGPLTWLTIVIVVGVAQLPTGAFSWAAN